MAFLVECDVEGCGATARVENLMMPIPPGWSAVDHVEHVARVPDKAEVAVAAMFPALGPIADAMRNAPPMPFQRRSYACPMHPMPKWKAIGALSMEQLDDLSKPPGEAPDWVADVLKKEGDGG